MTLDHSMRYGGLWRRLCAFILDLAILSPLLLITWWGNHRFHFFPLYSLPFIALFSLYYSMHLVRRFGGTPGKLIVGLRIRKLDGSPVGYREAGLRFLPEFALWLITSAGLIVPLFEIDNPNFRLLDVLEQDRVLSDLAPPWYAMAEGALQIWMCSEFIVLLTNRKRRALHDFVAGTVVIVHTPSPAAAI